MALVHAEGERAPFVIGEQRVVPVDTGDDKVEVEAARALGLDLGQVRRDHRAPVATLRAVALVAELAHDACEGCRHSPRRPIGLARRSGEAVTGERRGNDVERIAEIIETRYLQYSKGERPVAVGHDGRFGRLR